MNAKSAILVLSVLLSAVAVDAQEPQRPNIVFILADDSGFADFGCYGHPYARTPNIDRLAAEGISFRQFYATGVTCCPSRTGFMTGQWTASFATYPAVGGFGGQITITELLNRHGYATGHFGKWHIGPKSDAGTYGIDEIGEGGKEASENRGRDAKIYDAAIDFIKRHRDRPFYINVWSHISHHKVDPPQSYIARFRDLRIDESKFAEPMQQKFAKCREYGGEVKEHLQAYLADIHSMDEDIGRLRSAIEELGLTENTIVVFSSDQGPAPIRKFKKDDGNQVDPLRLNAMGYTGVHRGGKHDMHEGGVRVPLIVRWPGRTPANRVDRESVISGADWLPTLCSITGVKIDSADFVGEDVSAAWLGEGPHVRRKPLYWKASSPKSDAVIRAGKWKLFYPVRQQGQPELYDIVADPGESKNLAKKHPEVVKQLSSKVEAWLATLPQEYIKTKDKKD